MIEFYQIAVVVGILVIASALITFLFGLLTFLVAMLLRWREELDTYIQFRKDKQTYRKLLEQHNKEVFEKSIMIIDK